jgi:hypothetical protein
VGIDGFIRAAKQSMALKSTRRNWTRIMKDGTVVRMTAIARSSEKARAAAAVSGPVGRG